MSDTLVIRWERPQAGSGHNDSSRRSPGPQAMSGLLYSLYIFPDAIGVHAPRLSPPAQPAGLTSANTTPNTWARAARQCWGSSPRAARLALQSSKE